MAQQFPPMPPDDVWKQDQAFFSRDIAEHDALPLYTPDPSLCDDRYFNWEEDQACFIADLRTLAASSGGIYVRALEDS